MSGAYSSERVLREYLLFHYGAREEVLSLGLGPVEGLDFAVRTVSELIDVTDPGFARDGSALDLGCAVGRSSFELARHFPTVVGMDLSPNFVQAARKIGEEGSLDYSFPRQGEVSVPAIARIPDGIDAARVSFRVGDACSLPQDLGDFDLVHAANLLCRLPSPMDFLDELPRLVRPGGQLLLTTPFTWLEEFTTKDQWIGGRTDAADSNSALEAVLGKNFSPEKTIDIPFLLREHERKFQYGISLGVRWRRL